MRLNRGTIALLVLSVVIIVAIVVFSNQTPAATTPTPTVAGTNTGPIFASIDTSTVNRFEVRDNNGGQGTVMTRDAALVWAVAESATTGTTPVDQARINTQLGAFTTLNATDRFAATSLADFGLDAPDYTISITRLDGTVNTLRVGNANPGASRYYVQVDSDPDVILVQQATVAAMTSMITNPPFIPVPTATPGTTTPDTRRPLFTGVTSDQITGLVITDNTTGASTTLAKDASLNWTVAGTNSIATGQVDQFATFTAAANLAGLQYSSSFGPNDLPVFRLEDFGLDRPTYTIVASTNTGMQFTLLVGGLNPSSTEYYTLLSSIQVPLPTAIPLPTIEATGEATSEATSDATAAVLEATAEATAEVTLEATAEATVASTPTPVEVYLIQRDTIDSLVALVTAPPYLPEATPTVESTSEATVSADVTPEATPAP